ncbi:MAG: response regulator [Chloroflexota bacterium]
MTIVLADDHHVVRQGLKALLESEQDLSVVGEAGDGLEALKLVERVQPEVLVVDLMMGGVSGIEVARQTPRRSPRTAVVMLSMYNNEGYVLESLRAGAKAYVLKDSSAKDLVHAVRESVAGRRYLSPPLSEMAIEAYTKKSQGGGFDFFDSLSTREREVFYLVAQGCTNADIASRLSVSRRTVEIHRANMMRKLGLHNQAELIRYALERGVLPRNS